MCHLRGSYVSFATMLHCRCAASRCITIHGHRVMVSSVYYNGTFISPSGNLQCDTRAAQQLFFTTLILLLLQVPIRPFRVRSVSTSQYHFGHSKKCIMKLKYIVQGYIHAVHDSDHYTSRQASRLHGKHTTDNVSDHSFST